MSDNVILELSNIKMYFSPHVSLSQVLSSGKKRRIIKAVDDVSLKLIRGEIFGLIGESGSGKTTLGKIAEFGTNEQIYGLKGPSHPYTQKLLQATPLLHKRVDSLSYIPGTPPDLISPPKGCRFNPRCHLAFDKCRELEPPLVDIEEGHKVACWRCMNER